MTKIDMRIKLSIFQAEARDFAQHNLIDFYKSPLFLKEYRVEGNEIISLQKV